MDIGFALDTKETRSYIGLGDKQFTMLDTTSKDSGSKQEEESKART